MSSFARRWISWVVLCSAAFCVTAAAAPPQLKALIIDGQNNHAWQKTTPVIKKILGTSGVFETVDVATSPPKGKDMSGFKPDFSAYDVVVSNYNGAPWPADTQTAFVEYMKNGGGFVCIHAADNAFPRWPEYNEIIGLGGWGGRNQKSGPYVRWRDGKMVLDDRPGRGGGHGSQHAYPVDVRAPEHPITKGLPARWMHAKEELYHQLRGPAKNLEVLATAFSDPKTRGTGEHEPVLFTIRHGEGRTFHTVLGHGVHAMKCTGFITTLQRGAEWAATGKVTQAVPGDFPGPDAVQLRESVAVSR
jgi:type 1 glutamine amidotransferase